MALLPRPAAPASLVVELARIVGAGAVSTHDADRLAYARDAWARDVLRLRAGEVSAAPEVVVWPESAEEVAEILSFAERSQIPVVPYGAGSGRLGGARPSAGGIVLDLKRMRRIRRLDDDDLRAEVEPGIIGARLERSLSRKGYTLGHFPASIGCSTLGGWLATRSAGQMSTHYGKIEDMTLGIELVSPGRVRRLMVGPRPAEPDWVALTVGSEGCLGAITAAELRIRPQPESRALMGFRLRSVERGVEAIRRLLRAGLRPAVLRLYDALDTLLGQRGTGEDTPASETAGLELALPSAPSWLVGQGRLAQGAGKLRSALIRRTTKAVLGAPLLVNKAFEVLPSDCLLILGFEGHPGPVTAEADVAREILKTEGGEDLGPGPGEHWLRHRYDVSFKESKLYATGLFTDTLEVSATWDRVVPLHRAVRRAIAREAVVLAHFAHAYPEGCAICFTFTGAAGEPGNVAEALERYDRIWARALVAVHETGGSVAHHQGVGEAKGSAMPREHGQGGQRLLSALSRAFDPHRILNPGKLGIERFVPARSGGGRAAEGLPRAIAAAVGERNLLEQGGRRLVRPPDERALAGLLRVAHARGVPLRSDQSGLDRPPDAVELDLGRLEGVPRISEHASFVECEAGVPVERLEALLAANGLSLGPIHPAALGISVGAALARGLLVRRSVGFGDLSSLCFAVRGLLATGDAVETRTVPRSATGPELSRAFVGAGGRFGIITKATLRVVRRPSARETVSFGFRRFEQAVEAARVALRLGSRPVASRVFPEGDAGRWVVELAAVAAGLLSAQLGLLDEVVAREGGRPLSRGLESASGGRFDSVVEVEAPWSRVARIARGLEALTWGEVWIDFMTPEAATVVLRVKDVAARRAALEAVEGLGGRLLFASSETGYRRPPSGGQDPFEDVAAALSELLDPNDVLSGGAG